MFDAIAKQYFDSEETQAAGIKLLQEYRDASRLYPDWNDFEEKFLFRLDTSAPDKKDQHSLLDSAINWVNAVEIANGKSIYEDDLPKHQLISEQISEFLKSNKSNLTSIKLSEAMEKFLQEKRVNLKPNSDSEITFKNEIFPIALELFGDIETNALSKEHSNKYKQLILKYPRNRRKIKQYKTLTIDELIRSNVPESDQIAHRTKAYYLQRLSSFLQWLAKSDYATQGLELPLQGVISKTSPNIENRNQFTDSDLTKLFNSEQYLQCKFDKSFKYWVPLIALLTGARQNEICQLHVDDIYLEPKTNIWVFDINENDSASTFKSLKRPYHKRLIPIHHELINLGLLDFIEMRKKNRELRLFPELTYQADRNKYAGNVTKWFNDTYTNKKNCNITTPSTSFHSLRHTVINYLSHKVNIPESKFAYVLGHKPEGNIATDTYIKPSDLSVSAKWFKKLNFSHCIEFDRIPNWKRFRFARFL